MNNQSYLPFEKQDNQYFNYLPNTQYGTQNTPAFAMPNSNADLIAKNMQTDSPSSISSDAKSAPTDYSNAISSGYKTMQAGGGLGGALVSGGVASMLGAGGMAGLGPYGVAAGLVISASENKRKKQAEADAQNIQNEKDRQDRMLKLYSNAANTNIWNG